MVLQSPISEPNLAQWILKVNVPKYRLVAAPFGLPYWLFVTVALPVSALLGEAEQ